MLPAAQTILNVAESSGVRGKHILFSPESFGPALLPKHLIDICKFSLDLCPGYITDLTKRRKGRKVRAQQVPEQLMYQKKRNFPRETSGTAVTRGTGNIVMAGSGTAVHPAGQRSDT